MLDRVRVVHAHDPKPAPQRLEIAAIVALLLAPVPLAAINFDNDAPLDQEVNTADPGNHDLALDSKSCGAQGDPCERLDARLGTRVEVVDVEAVLRWHHLVHTINYRKTGQPESQRAVDDRDHGGRRLTHEGVSKRDLDAAARAVNLVG